MIAKAILEGMNNGSAIRKMFEEGKRLTALYGAENVFDFSLGNPDVPTTAATQAAYHRALDEAGPAGHGYMNNAGFEATREAVARRENARSGLALDSSSIVMTTGAAGALSIIFKAILDPGDEVIVPSPYFGEYQSYVGNAGGRLVPVATDPEDFSLDLDAISRAITSRTKAVLINTPNNPTGQVYLETDLRQLNDLLLASPQTIYLVSDEPYAELIYDGISLPSILSVFQNGIVAYSWSKSLSLPGERIGYVAVSPRCADHDLLAAALTYCNRTLGFVNAPALSQRAIATVMDDHVDAAIYRERRDLLHGILTRAGFSCFLPKGAFYLFPRSPEPDDAHFADVCCQHGLLFAPGSAFGTPGHFRLAYCVSEDMIRRSEPVFRKVAEIYGLKGTA